MTQDEIIEMAKQVGMDYIEYISEDSMKQVKAFAHLVAAKEREACADLRNMLHGFDGKGRQEMVDAMNRGLDEYQAAIRARGQA